MTWNVTLTEGVWQLELVGAPSYCHSLEAAPDSREPMLAEGTWLVLGFAVWSGPDRHAIDVALNVAQAFQGDLLLGVRPFDDHAEFETWSEAQERAGSPVWLLFREGTLLSERMGQVSVDDLVGWIAGGHGVTEYDQPGRTA